MSNNFINPLSIDIKVNSALRDRRIYINGVIDDNLALETCHFMQRIYDNDIKTENNNKEITLLINSYGGSVWAGNSIIGMMNYLKSKGYKIIGIVQSMCFSMAFDILCNCDVRYGYSHSEYMIHQTQGGNPYGALVKAERMLKYNKRQWEKSIEYYIRDTKITKEQIEDLYEKDLEWFMLSEEALELNVIQKIL